MTRESVKKSLLRKQKKKAHLARREILAESNPDMLFLGDPGCTMYDDALLGTAERQGFAVACYDYEKCIEVLMKESEMDVHEAREWMEFNVIGAGVGENGPVFLYRYESF